MNLIFEVQEQTITRKDSKKVVADSKNYLRASFVFSPDWAGVKTAIFKRESSVYHVTLENDMCYVPFQVLEGQGAFSVSVFCGDLITANTETVQVFASGYSDGEIPPPPGPLEITVRSYAGEQGVRYLKVEDGVLFYLDGAGNLVAVNPPDEPVPIPKTLGVYSITSLVTGVSSELMVSPVAPSKAMAKYAVFADEENISGILPVSDGFVSLPVVFESDRITVNFYDADNVLTLTARLKQLTDVRLMKYGELILREDEME
ncbi:MAG: hypothetical protein BWY15_00412 [Firmicutes bacterium ADurb.Bin193]|nr:MAG: hypothetical protein BWY15_00412 [Firmicutes bacterium ADurb.Bin193]